MDSKNRPSGTTIWRVKMHPIKKGRYGILIADDDLKQGESIRDIIYEMACLYPGSMGVTRSQLDITVISKTQEVENVISEIFRTKTIPYNIILADIFMPFEKDEDEPTIEGGWLRFYRTISELPGYDPEITSELLLVAITNKSEDAVPIKQIIREENHKCSSPWVDFLHKPDRPVFRGLSEKPELLDENSWVYLIMTAIRKYNDLCWRRTFVHCDLDALLPVSTMFSDVRGKVFEFRDQRLILLAGESGTGKEKIAKYLHQQKLPSSEDIKRDYASLHCDSVTIDKMKSTFIGIEKGVLVENYNHSQLKTEAGLLEKYHDGTIFFDGIDTNPQKARILDMVLNELIHNNWAYQRIGGTINLSFKGTLILGISSLSKLQSSDNQKKNIISQDLYYTIEPYTIEIPPLRNRKSDILPLAETFLNIDKNKDDTSKRLDEAAQKWLLKYNWPGNITELEGLMKKVSLRNKLTTKITLEMIKKCLPPKNPPLIKTKENPAPRFHKWVTLGDACFIINTNNNSRVLFYYKGKMKDLRLKKHSRTETLITLLASGTLYDHDIKGAIKSKEKPTSIVRSVNTTINNKIAGLGFSGVPANTAFIHYNSEHKHYELMVPAKDKSSLDAP
jgi:hypothetical protein